MSNRQRNIVIIIISNNHFYRKNVRALQLLKTKTVKTKTTGSKKWENEVN